MYFSFHASKASSNISFIFTASSTTTHTKRKWWIKVAWISILSLLLGAGAFFFSDAWELMKKGERRVDFDKKYDHGTLDIGINTDTGTLRADYTQPPIEMPKLSGDTLRKLKGIYISRFNNQEFVKSGWVNIAIGNIQKKVTAKDLLHGVEVINSLFADCVGSQVMLVVRNSRLLVKAEFVDLMDEDYIGDIQYDKWTVTKDGKIWVYTGKNSVAVRDKRNLLIFEISYNEKGNLLTLCGYFLDGNRLLVLGGMEGYHCIQKDTIGLVSHNWRNTGIVVIHSIDSAAGREFPRHRLPPVEQSAWFPTVD